MTEAKNSSIKQSKICPKCQYEFNDNSAKVCSICKEPLLKVDQAQVLRNTHLASSKKIISQHSFSISSLIQNRSRAWKQNCTNLINKPRLNSQLKELQKPINLLGLFFLSLGIMLWMNYFLVISPQKNVIKPEIVEQENKTEIPQGLFSYGGAPIFAPLVASGVNGLIETEYPGYELRYTKPLNQDYSSFNGIRMLIDGELSFAYNERPLTDQEYKIANLRNINLKQIPIALDGVVIYGNNQLTVQQLNVEQVRKIFLGEIDNWHSIDSTIEDLPIVPVVVSNENMTPLGINNSSQKVADSTEYASNYTQALRKIISTPGSVSFASAAIVKNQKLIKMFELGDGSSSSYVSPLVNESLNIADFKSGKYPLTRRIFLVLREDGTLDQEAGILYANFLTSNKGQDKVEQSGLVRVINHANRAKE